jgi:hypothetical protein
MRSLGRPQSPGQRLLDPIGAKPVVSQDRRVLTGSIQHPRLAFDSFEHASARRKNVAG